MLKAIEVVGPGQLVDLADGLRDHQPGEECEEPDTQEEDDRHRPRARQTPALEPADLRVEASGDLSLARSSRLEIASTPATPDLRGGPPG
jgi:hypothetical protein